MRSISNARMTATAIATLTSTSDNYPHAQVGFNENAAVGISSSNSDQIFQDVATIIAEGVKTYDFDDGGMTDPFGALVFESIVGLLFVNTGATDLKLTGDALGLATDGDTIEAGGFIQRSFGTAGRDIVADTGDEITITNLSADTAGSFKILIIGKGA